MSTTKTAVKGKITLSIHEAKELVEVNLIGTMDPYCSCEMGKEKFKTKVHTDGGKTPKWEQDFIFNLDGYKEDYTLHLTLYASKFVSDTKLARCDINMDKLLETENAQWIQVVDPDAFKKIAGYIKITAKFVGSGMSSKKTEEKSTVSTSSSSNTTQQKVVVVQQQQQQQKIVYVQQPTQQVVYQQQQPQVVYVQQQTTQPQIIYQQPNQQQQIVYTQQVQYPNVQFQYR
jgi:hypothetical protein